MLIKMNKGMSKMRFGNEADSLIRSYVCKITWDEFTSQDKEDIRDGMSPEEYVRKLRDVDREG